MSKITFVDGDPSQGTLGTIVTAAFLNAVNNHRHSGLDVDGAGALDYAVATGSSNAYAIDLTPDLGAYISGMPVFFKANHANTGAATLNIDSLGAKSIKRINGDALSSGDILIDQIVCVVYDGTNFIMISPTAGSAKHHGQCRLTKSSSNLLLSRCDGKDIIINGSVCAIPSDGVTLAPTGLSASTTYFIYAYMNSGTMTLEASTTTHATDSTTGVEIKSGDATRTLVGMARTTSGTAWADSVTQRFVLSYFNRRSKGGENSFSASSSSASWIELNSSYRMEFLTWSDESVSVSFQGICASATAYHANQSIGIDGTSVDYTEDHSYAAQANGFTCIVEKSGLSEGYHYATGLGFVGGGTFNFNPVYLHIKIRG